jgi:hypothetical protein
MLMVLLLPFPFEINQLSAQTNNALPVLRVSFDGKFKKGMTEYLNGKMQLTDVDGSVVEMSAKFKTRGATAASYMMKPSFNMKLQSDDYSEEVDSMLLGIRSCSSWILDAMAIDRICMRNRVCFDIWNEFSRLPYETQFDSRYGTIGRFIEVYINDKYYGIYCLNDRINRKLLDLKKTKEEKDGSVTVRGVLYKSGTSDINPQEKPGYNEDSTACVVSWHNAWELTYPDDFGGIKAWQALQDAFANGRNAEFVKKYFYLENLADYQILIMALSIGDNWGNKNHYLSVRNINKDINDPDPAEADKRRFVLIPWDLDTSLGGRYDGKYYDGNYSVWDVKSIGNNALYPISAVIGDAEYKAILKRRWIEGRKGAFSIESVKAKLEKYRDLFIESGAWQRMVSYFDSQKSRPKYVNDLAREIQLIEEWYEDRFHEMDAYFGIEDGVNMIMMPDSDEKAIYDLFGRKIESSFLAPGIYIIDGDAVVIE